MNWETTYEGEKYKYWANVSEHLNSNILLRLRNLEICLSPMSSQLIFVSASLNLVSSASLTIISPSRSPVPTDLLERMSFTNF